MEEESDSRSSCGLEVSLEMQLDALWMISGLVEVWSDGEGMEVVVVSFIIWKDSGVMIFWRSQYIMARGVFTDDWCLWWWTRKMQFWLTLSTM